MKLSLKNNKVSGNTDQYLCKKCAFKKQDQFTINTCCFQLYIRGKNFQYVCTATVPQLNSLFCPFPMGIYNLHELFGEKLVTDQIFGYCRNQSKNGFLKDKLDSFSSHCVLNFLAYLMIFFKVSKHAYGITLKKTRQIFQMLAKKTQNPGIFGYPISHQIGEIKRNETAIKLMLC